MDRSDIEVPDWVTDTSHLVLSEDKRWDAVEVGDLVQIEKHHGPVVEVNVDPIFCAHRFEDGTVKSHPRDRQVATKRPATDDEKTEWAAERCADWIARRAGQEG